MHSVRLVNRKLALAMATCLPPLRGFNNALLQLLTPSTPREELRVESRNEALSAAGEAGGTRLQIDIFRSQVYKTDSCTSWYLGKC